MGVSIALFEGTPGIRPSDAKLEGIPDVKVSNAVCEDVKIHHC